MHSVRYRIKPKFPEAHIFEVSCTVTEPDAEGQRFALPAWIPGSYMIRDFAKNVVRVSAANAAGEVRLTKLDKDTWQCEPCAGPLTISYEVYAWELSVRAAHLDTTHAYFNGASVFMRVVGRECEACDVELLAPDGDAYREWRVATSLETAGAARYGFGAYRAHDYEELVDHPVEMGEFALVGFEASGVPHEVAVTGWQRGDLDRLARDLQVICEYQIRFFGAPAPMARYLFLIMVVGKGYGGLEHRASTSLICSRDDLPMPGDASLGDGYRTLLGLCSHEYFHTWNIKRILPAAFRPYDFGSENYTRLLWAFEGVTSYYQNLVLVRAGIITRESYLELLAQTATRVLRGSGRFKQSLADSSFDAWTKFYKADENATNAVVSYYTKGALAALALDLTIRRRTGGTRSLDEVMRALWERYGRAGKGVAEDEWERLAAEVAGVDLDDFFERAVRGTEDLEWADLLADVGVIWELRPAESEADAGGKPARDARALARRVSLGVRLADEGGEARLAAVLDAGAAQRAGLAPGDVIVAVDGLKVMRADLEKRLACYAPGETVQVHAFRRDELRAFDVVLQSPPADTCVLRFEPDVDAVTAARRDAWLGPHMA